MTERLRELERRWKETGSVEDEARFLAERVRIGEVTRARAALAAYCGSEAARRMSDEVEAPSSLDDWIAGLSRWDEMPEVAAVAYSVALRPIVPDWSGTFPSERAGSELLVASIEAMEELARCPCEAHRRAAVRTCVSLWDTHGVDAARRAVAMLEGANKADAVRREVSAALIARALR